LLALPFALLIAVIGAGAAFVSYVLWPTWPRAAISPNAPALPVTVSGVLFNVPPAAVRVAVQRQPGPHDRVDLEFLWPSLQPPEPHPAAKPASATLDAAPVTASDRLFVTIAGAGAVLAPQERLKSIYPRYVAAEATQGPDGLAVLPFRSGTPYQGEDLIYVAAQPDQFFTRCTRAGAGPTPGTCLHERRIDEAELTMRFPRDWLKDWRGLTAGFDRLVAQLHPQSGKSN
jgi:hypothetical protein